MKKHLLVLAAAFLLVAMAHTASAAAYVEVTLAPVSRSHKPPPLGRKQGWLTITNRDWHSYTVTSSRGRIHIHRDGSGRKGGVVIPSGTSRTIALEKDTYDVYGSHSEHMKVRVREGRTSTISLEPFGGRQHSGLRGVISDGGGSRKSILFDAPRRQPEPPKHKPAPAKPEPHKAGPAKPAQQAKPAPGKPTPSPAHKSGKQDGWGHIYGGR